LLTGVQIRIGRKLLRWQLHQLARAAKLRLETVERAERAEGEPAMTIGNLAAIRRALETAGIELLSPELGVGVRLIKDRPLCDRGVA
jgi:hypothetical protein